ncbi:murein L,D-transpeptidase catalytic domain-containing protein [Aureibaculum conchae]|uniref:murein L,D-transpeptidase catalytic domain-containing protein n=1 Tax=Aureibaculum sp. 2308TA14-22 TaxID=3108392 RepID=UPI003392074D
MINKFTILVLILSFCSCKKEKQGLINLKQNLVEETVNTEPKELDYAKEIEHIKSFAKKGDYNQKFAIMINYGLHSGKNRLFVVDLKKDSIIKKALVCHGSGKGKNTKAIPTVFSNVSESHCSSLGMAVMGKRAYSRWGKNYKYWIDGLEETNSNMRKRIVVLHGWKEMPEKETYPKPIATSWGCPTVTIDFLDQLDAILKKNEKVLFYSFKE